MVSLSRGMLKPFLKAVIARCLFAIHGIITIWRVTETNSDRIYYLLIIPVLLLPLEMMVTLKFADEGEWKWFCPSVLLYLASVIPGLWILQFDLYHKRTDYLDSTDMGNCSGDFAFNLSGLTSTVAGFHLSIPLEMTDDAWALTLEQVLIALLIVGRWLLPKGALTREQLSQLLLIYIGVGADILEFFGESVEEEAVICNLLFITIILVIWSWSLAQFTLVRTSVSAPTTKVTKRRKSVVSGGLGGCCGSDIWGLCITIVMQDGPFLVIRLYLIIAFKAFSQLLLFFTIKNILVILLQLYRMTILTNTSLCPEESDDHDLEGQQVNEMVGKSNEIFEAADADDHDLEGQQVNEMIGKSNEIFEAGEADDEGKSAEVSYEGDGRFGVDHQLTSAEERMGKSSGGSRVAGEQMFQEADDKGDQRPSLIGTNM